MDYTRLSPEALVLECLRTADEQAWEEFIRRFHPLISRVVLRIAKQWGETSSDEVDDLIQETYLKLCAEGLKVAHKFTSSHQDAIFGYIKVFTANLTHDHFKASRSRKRGHAVTTSLDENKGDRNSGFSNSSAETLERRLLLGRIDNCLRANTLGPNAERDRRIFWLYYRVGLTASAIASLPGIGLSTKGVETTILRLGRQIRKQLANLNRSSGPSFSDEGIRSPESL